MFKTPDNAIERKREVEIVLEKIKDAFILAGIGSASMDDKKRVREMLIACFQTSSWTEIESLPLEGLRGGLTDLRIKLDQLEGLELPDGTIREAIHA